MDNENTSAIQQQQQFCLRWHNHQTSLLGSLPLLLDQSHLTDVTLSAEGKTLRAHRVVLSACSTFFSELFRALDSSNHPVIVIPGASFGAMVALLNFMYSGEVNVFESQIPALLALAETLGIKGLADFHNNLQSPTKSPKFDDSLQAKESDTPAPSPTLVTKLSSPLENFFMKSFQFYPNLIPQPLNFSQSALNKTTEFLAKYQQQCNLFQAAKDNTEANEGVVRKQSNSADRKPKEPKKIDKIAETLRTCSNLKGPNATDMINQVSKMSMNILESAKQTHLKPPMYPASAQHFLPDDHSKTTADLIMDQHQANLHSYTTTENFSPAADSLLEKTITNPTQSKIANSKLYATCFICHKQLSNQYNLRVHLETHQNVRYACSVCSHVSRSKDALRKHVSYRHPGAPSPCESEARRKRSRAVNTTQTAFSPVLKSDAIEEQVNPASFLFIPNQINQFSQQQTTSQLTPTPSLVPNLSPREANSIKLETSAQVKIMPICSKDNTNN